MQNGSAVAEYMITIPRYVLIRWSITSMMYIGSRSIVAGNICVTRSPSRPVFFPVNEYRENAYPHVEARTTPVAVTTRATSVLLASQRKNGRSVKRAA